MESSSWVVYLCLFFIFLTKLLEYTSSYHDRWLSQLSITPQTRRVSQKYHETFQQRVNLQEENRSLSAQDNYARWTKNNRKLSELDKQLAKLREELQMSTASSRKFFSNAKLLGLTVPFWIVKIWKRGHIVYSLPRADLFPKIVNGVWARGWLYLVLAPLNFLRKGSFVTADYVNVGVSLGIWIWALQKTVNTVEFLVQQLLLNDVVPPPKEKSTKCAARTFKPSKTTGQASAPNFQYEITDDKIELD
ncbi:probable Golgi to ER traffic protein 1 [Zygosaccharomyces bailii]|nr:probable Golgi to ER traffic protein 1 [Zygosaccharomyces bailii]